MNKRTGLSASSKGFTIVELMIAVAIVGILAAIAIPSYSSHIAKANRADAKAVLLQSAQDMERRFTGNMSYAGALPQAVSPVGSSGSGVKYNLSFSVAASATGYTIQAVPTGSMVSDSCGTYTVNQAGVETNGGGGDPKC